MLRRRAGDAGGAITDPTLNAIWEEVSGASSDTVRIEAALYLIWDAFMASAAKLHDYKAGQSDEKLSQVFAHAEKMLERYQNAYDAATSQRQQVVIAAIRPVSHQERETPAENEQYTRRRRDYPS